MTRFSCSVVVVSAAALVTFAVSSTALLPHRTPAPAPAVSVEPAGQPQPAVSPADGASGVAPADPITVTTADAELTGMALTAPDGTTVPGEVSPDRRTWRATAAPAYDTAYRLTGTATGPGGTTPIATSFRTARPTRLVAVSMPAIARDAVVGVAAPIEVRFDRHVDAAARPAAERALSVTTSVPVPGSWAWLPDDGGSSRVHWRPERYWPAYTSVTVAAHLYGVDLGRSGFGGGDLDRTFTIGRSQIVRADVTSHRMVVVRDGQVVSDVPASYGLDSDPGRVTHDGVHVVTSKAETVFMTNERYGYRNVEMHWAVRISNNGEFVHANPASAAAQGKRNVTHGCVNLTTDDAKAYYDTAVFGDPVEVTGSAVPLSAADGDVYDWAIPYATWRTMSAANGT